MPKKGAKALDYLFLYDHGVYEFYSLAKRVIPQIQHTSGIAILSWLYKNF